jgi:hypothetical protein
MELELFLVLGCVCFLLVRSLLFNMALHGVGLRLGGVLSPRSRVEALRLDVPPSFQHSSTMRWVSIWVVF